MKTSTVELNLNEMEMVNGGGTRAAIIAGAIGGIFGGYAGALIGSIGGPVGAAAGGIACAVIFGGAGAAQGASMREESDYPN